MTIEESSRIPREWLEEFETATQDASLCVARDPANGTALVAALRDIGFALTETQPAEIVRGKDFVQLKNGPFDFDLVFAPDGIEKFEDAYARRIAMEKSGFPSPLHRDRSADREQGSLGSRKGPG